MPEAARMQAEELRLATTQPASAPTVRTQAASAYAAVQPRLELLADAEGRYDRGRDLDGLDEALRIFASVQTTRGWRALAADRRADWGRRASLIYSKRYEVSGAEDDLRRAVATATHAVEDAAAAYTARGDAAAAATAIAALLTARTGNPMEITLPIVRQTMASGIEEARREVGLIEPAALSVLGAQLTDLYIRNRHQGDADRAVDVLRHALSLRSERRLASDAVTEVRLGAILLQRFKEAGVRADADESISVMRGGVEHADDDHRAKSLDALGCALLARSEHVAGNDLNEAVSQLSAAVALDPNDPWIRANLGTALSARFGRDGDLGDRARAVELLASALAAIPPSAPDRRQIEQNALAAGVKVVGSSDPGRLRALVDATPAGERGRAARMAALATMLLDAAETDLDPAVLDDAVRSATQARDATAPAAADKASIEHTLGHALAVRFAVLGDQADLDGALEALGQAARNAGRSAAERPEFLLTLAQARAMRAARTGSAPDLRRADKTFSDACGAAEQQNAFAAQRAASAWVHWAAEEGRWESAAQAGRRAMSATDRIHRVQVGRENRDTVLAATGTIHADAAIALARTGHPVDALLALEHGRARTLSEQLGRDRAELDSLSPAGRDDLAVAFSDAAAAARGAARAGNPGDLSEAEAALQTVIGSIREVPGHSAFLQDIGADDVMRAGNETPLIYLAAGELGAVVIAALPGGDVRWQLLEGVDHYVLAGLTSDYLAAAAARGSAPHAWRTGLDAVGEALGALLWPTVLSVLGSAERAVLVPTGLFGLLPLQVGWWGARARRCYAIDELELSIAPNAQTIESCRRLAATADVKSVLTVASPERSDMIPLPLAGAESDAVRAAFPTGERLVGHQATRAAVLDALGRHDVLHFACHGQMTPDQPLDGALLLAGDDTLRVRDLLNLPLSGARLAVLSACETAVIGATLVDEVLGLPAAFLQAGVAGVIGTSWRVGDPSAALVVRRFFDTWKGERPAAALRAAQLWLRNSSNAEKYAAYPNVAPAPPATLDLEDLEDWGSGRDHISADHWGAFLHVGA